MVCSNVFSSFTQTHMLILKWVKMEKVNFYTYLCHRSIGGPLGDTSSLSRQGISVFKIIAGCWFTFTFLSATIPSGVQELWRCGIE